MSKTVRIGTRESKLAVVQARLVAAAIDVLSPKTRVELVMIKTTGDIIQDRALDELGGKGLFVKELDEALRRGEVDLCVHSYKDMPMEEDADLPVVAVSQREDPRDVLILPEGASELDRIGAIGCSSMRRRAQLAVLYAGIKTAPVRGNVPTRLEKLQRGEYSALVLAAAGIKRLGLWGRVSRVFETNELLPAACQGALAVQGRRGESHAYLNGYCCKGALDATSAERAFIKRLGCGCGAPVGAYARIQNGVLHLRGMLAEDGEPPRYDEIYGERQLAAELGARLAEKMLGGARP